MNGNYCYQCGKRLVGPRYPGNDPELGPARYVCPDKKHVPLSDLLEQRAAEAFMECAGAVLETLEKHLDATPDGIEAEPDHPWTAPKGDVENGPSKHDLECAQCGLPVEWHGTSAEYRALRALRTDIIEHIIEVPEEQYDNDPNELENPENH